MWLWAGGLTSSLHRLLTGLFECLNDMAAASLEPGKIHNTFYDLVSGVTHHHFYLILFVRSEFLSHSREENWAPPFKESIKEFMDIF